MDNFTLTQLKKIIKYFNIKIKVGGKKADLIQRIEDHIIFDGYEFHVKGSDHEIIINPDELHVEKNQYVRGPKKSQYTYKKVSNTYKELPSKKVKIINKENIYEIKPKKKVKIIKTDYIPPLLIKPSKKVKIIKRDYIPSLLSNKENIEEPSSSAVVQRNDEDWKDIYRQYKLDSDNAIKDAKKLNPKLKAKDAFEINQEYAKKFTSKYGITPNQFLHQNRLKYDKKYAKNYYEEQKKVSELENYAKDAPIKNALKQKYF